MTRDAARRPAAARPRWISSRPGSAKRLDPRVAGVLAALLAVHQGRPAATTDRTGSRAWPPRSAARVGGCRPGDHRDLRGHRPLDRRDDGVHERRGRAAMRYSDDQTGCVAIVIGVLLLGMVLGGINGGLVVVTRVADIIVTLAMSFVWAGCALLVLNVTGGQARQVAAASSPSGALRHRVDAEARRRRPARRRGDLDPTQAVPARPVDLRDRQRSPGGISKRGVRSGGPDRRLCASAACSPRSLACR